MSLAKAAAEQINCEIRIVCLMPGTCIVHFLQRAKQDISAKRNTRYTGIILFGTGGGASRYDGKSFRNFTTKEGLSNNDLTTVMEDKTGNLWFSTRGEPCFYDGKTFTVLKNKDGKAFNNVWSIIEDKAIVSGRFILLLPIR